jgi:hypothetical protein
MKTRHKTIQIRITVGIAETVVAETIQTQMVAEMTQTTMRLPILTTTIQIGV